MFHIYMKTFKNLSTKYYQENRERLKIKAHESHENLLKEQKKKSDCYRNLSEDEKKNWMIIKKSIKKWEKKHFIIITKKYSNLENFACL